MSPSHVLEPTYQRLKQKLIHGRWPSGAKLEAMRLADEFGVSMTPIRDCLNQLVGEGLVELTPGQGFRVPLMTEQLLRDMLDANQALLDWALQADGHFPIEEQGRDRPRDYPSRLAAAFSTLSMGSGNRFLVRLVDYLGERLHVVRMHEPDIIPDAMLLLQDIERSVLADNPARFEAVSRYHIQCQARVTELVGSLEL